MKTNRFKYLIAAIVPMMVIAGPLHAQQKSEIVSTASLKNTSSEDDNETTKPNAYQLFGNGDSKLDSLNKLMDHYVKATYNYEHSRAYEIAKIKSKGFSTETPPFYDNDTLRHIMASIDKISKDFKALNSRELALNRDSLGTLIGDYFKTTKFREINLRLQTKYHIDPAKSYADNNVDYRRYHNELMKEVPQKITNDLRQLKDLSNKFRGQLQNPLYISDIKRIHIVIDSMTSYYERPHIAQYTRASYEAMMDVPADERQKARDKVFAHAQNPEFRANSEKVVEYSKEMREYYQSTPEVKVREDAWKNELKIILADDYDIIVHPARGLEYLYKN